MTCCRPPLLDFLNINELEWGETVPLPCANAALNPMTECTTP